MLCPLERPLWGASWLPGTLPRPALTSRHGGPLTRRWLWPGGGRGRRAVRLLPGAAAPRHAKAPRSRRAHAVRAVTTGADDDDGRVGLNLAPLFLNFRKLNFGRAFPLKRGIFLDTSTEKNYPQLQNV